MKVGHGPRAGAPQLIADILELHDQKEVGANAIRRLLNTLTERERRVLILLYGLEDGNARTLQQVADEFGLTRARIQQIRDKALCRMRHPSRMGRLKSFVV